MKNINDNIDSPLILKVSFNKLLEHYEELANNEDEFIAAKAQRVLKTQEPYPILREGFSDISILEKYEKEVKIILQDSFSEVLSKNEIKTASVPFHDFIFNSSKRFKTILQEAGPGFELSIKNMPADDLYIIACTIILKFCYGFDINVKRPFYYEIPDKNGVLRYYKILYNADFTEIVPTDKAIKITQSDYDELIDNFENVDIWKEKFPPNSYSFKGFVISNIFDVTDDQSISNVKSSLITDDKSNQGFSLDGFYSVFRSLLNISDLRVGFSSYNRNEEVFEAVHGNVIPSFLLNGKRLNKCSSTLCEKSFGALKKEKKIYAISDVDKYFNLSNGKAPQYKSLVNQGIKSAVLAPIFDENDELLGIFELVSNQRQALNSVNANKLIDVMPYILSAVRRSNREHNNLIEAVIQQECTSIHPSVLWKFEAEAKNFIEEQIEGKNASFKQISFQNVYPLFGQIDIKGSSEARNVAIQKDLSLQLNAIKDILNDINSKTNLPIYEQLMFRIDSYLEDLNEHFQVDSEQHISKFISSEINPLLLHKLKLVGSNSKLEGYFEQIDPQINMFYIHRKNYDSSVTLINKKMAATMDKKQVEAQLMYPHYYERFKTDGVEHNLYIGESITRKESFNPVYIYNLRLWQLQVMCEMENIYYQMQPNLPIHLDVASMILVFNQPLTISFRMDEKQFDVDGTYNARYEVVKKRVDKAYIKGTQRRITEKGKMTIVYSQKEDEYEYLNYIKFLQSKRYLDTDVEIVELEDLQAVTGLKAIRVSILYSKENNSKDYYSYEDLMKEIKA